SGLLPDLHSFPTRRSSDLNPPVTTQGTGTATALLDPQTLTLSWWVTYSGLSGPATNGHFHGPAAPTANAGVQVPFTNFQTSPIRSEEHTSELQSRENLVCR